MMGSAGTARLVALAIVALVVAMMSFSLVSLVLPGTERIPERPWIIDFLAVTGIVGAFPLVGLAIVTRRPRNPVGWLFLLMGLAMSAATFTTEYVDRVVHAGAELPAADLGAWLSSWSWFVGPMVALPLAILLFPDGQLPTWQWRVALTVALTVPLVTIAAVALAPGPLPGYEDHYANPLGVGGPIGDVLLALSRSEALGFAAFVLPGAIALVATVARTRRSHDTERQQLKWLLYTLAIFVVAIGAAFVTLHQAAWTLALLSFAAVPIAAGIAILRYRLYDIDVVIRRTLIYGLAMAVLAVVYVLLVLVLQAGLSPLTGGDMLPVALSTVAIAALFGPVRSRVRAIVDRRFYRSRYDAQLMLEVFAGGLRDEVELEAVAGTLVAVATRAVSPRSSAIWIRSRAVR